MNITRTSRLSGITRTRDLNTTQEQLGKWASGMLIQEAMPSISSDDREFIKTGITKEEWEIMFEGDE